MRGLLQTSTLVLATTLIAIATVAWLLWPADSRSRSVPARLEPGEQEIVWLYPATNTAAWERFISAVKRTAAASADSTEENSVYQIRDQAFPPNAAATPPELIFTVPGLPGKLAIRWYKLTSDQDTGYWVRTLLARQPPPLAIIGGNTSNAAIELAQSLEDESRQLGLGDQSPLLLLTTATADSLPGNSVADTPLAALYPGRTFRFCFTNRQMAHAVVEFLRQRPDLWPDADPVYLTNWRDDPYSRDLNQRFLEALRLPAAAASGNDWALAASLAAGLGPSWPLIAMNSFRLDTPASWELPHSIGGFDHPNRLEVAEAARLMRAKLERFGPQRRPLLILPGAAVPSRRFLVALRRSAPDEARRFVVATGDAIPFNVIYRDRNIAWPIQDLPFHLVFFCHRNPVDADAGFPLDKLQKTRDSAQFKGQLAGTEDLLLMSDIAGAVLRAWRGTLSSRDPGRPGPVTAEFAHHLRETTWRPDLDRVAGALQRPRFFTEAGDRHSGSGEHVVYLRPVTRGSALLAEAQVEVWARQRATAGAGWKLRAALPVYYEGYLEQEPGF